eukprot:1093786-Pyramimonas_sp.AAC.1
MWPVSRPLWPLCLALPASTYPATVAEASPSQRRPGCSWTCRPRCTTCTGDGPALPPGSEGRGLRWHCF